MKILNSAHFWWKYNLSAPDIAADVSESANIHKILLNAEFNFNGKSSYFSDIYKPIEFLQKRFISRKVYKNLKKSKILKINLQRFF